MLTLIASTSALSSRSSKRILVRLFRALHRVRNALAFAIRQIVRYAARLVVHLGYRVEARGLERVPQAGPALLVCNHVSYLDAVVIYGQCGRPVRYVMDHRIYNLSLLKPLFRLMGAIPIAPRKHRPDVLAAAYDRIAEALAAGELVCLFPEGQITRCGGLNVFRSGVERVVERTPVPVVPMALRGLWGSLFSRAGGAGRQGRFGRASRLGLAVGEAVAPDDVCAARLQHTVRRLRGRRR